MRKILSLIIVSFLGIQSFSQQPEDSNFDCFTIIAGKDVTQSGSVVIAHNEDDHGKNLVNWFKVPEKSHGEDETIELQHGGEVPQVSTTNGYMWLEMPGQRFADSYVNEHGVVIASNACASKEKNPDLTNGGIGYWLRRLMAQRAESAREAVKIGGELIEKYGYASSGRTYSIADPEEAWVLAAVNGKHWVAQRIPNDKVMVIPNYYTITSVNLDDSKNFMGSDDLIEYAKEKNWYNPEEDGEFNFRKAYGHPASLATMGNIARKWKAIEMLAGKEFSLDEPFPFLIQPEKRLKLKHFMRVLENHYEGTKFDDSQNYQYGNPHSEGHNSICSVINQYGFVTEIRDDMPTDIGLVMWLAPRRPCIQPFIPWYYGMKDIPEDFALTTPEKALNNHFNPPENILEKSEGHAFVEYVDYASKMDKHYKQNIPMISAYKRALERELFSKTKEIEKRALELYPENKEKAIEIITDFTKKYIEQTRQKMEEGLEREKTK